MKLLNLKSIVVLGALATVFFAALGVSGQGRYTNRYSKRDVNNTIRRLENSSDSFRREFDRQMDSSTLNGTFEEDRLNRIVANYENALDRLRRQFDMTENWWQNRADVQGVMGEARQVNTMMSNLSFARRIERQWNSMRRDINKLADTYDLPAVDGGGYSPVPNWATGTFYSRNPQTGGNITLAVSNDGTVVVTFDNGTTNTASMLGEELNNNGIIARVSRTNNGIRTTRVDNGESIEYFRDPNMTGGNNGGGMGGGNVPRWAVGVFTARSPQGGTVTLSIGANGNVIVIMNGQNSGYATLNGDRLNNNGIIARVSQIRNGIRTTRLDNGEAIDYFVDNSGAGNGQGNNPMPGGNVPSWAVGRFFGRNPQTGGVIVMEIAKDGNVTITVDNGQPVYATMNGERLFTAASKRVSHGFATESGRPGSTTASQLTTDGRFTSVFQSKRNGIRKLNAVLFSSESS